MLNRGARSQWEVLGCGREGWWIRLCIRSTGRNTNITFTWWAVYKGGEDRVYDNSIVTVIQMNLTRGPFSSRATAKKRVALFWMRRFHRGILVS
jgi:hypothetical protein